MGVLRWLDRIDPGRWERACAQIGAEGTRFLDLPAATSFLEELGVTTSDGLQILLADLEDEEDDDDVRGNFLGQLLEAAVTEQTWFLGKSMPELEEIASALRGGEVLRGIVHFEAMDLPSPEACRSSDLSFYGCIPSARLAPIAAFLEPLGTREELEAALSSPPSLLLPADLAPSRERALELLPHYFEEWIQLRDAVLTTHARRHHLGLGQSS